MLPSKAGGVTPYSVNKINFFVGTKAWEDLKTNKVLLLIVAI